MSRVGVILAGGRGERMQAGRNKALLAFAGQPVLLHSVRTFRACVERLLVVSADVDMPAIADLLPGVFLVGGGATRHGSEWNALQALRESCGAEDVIAIHDAARPLVAEADVRAVFAAAESHGAAMLASPAGQPALALAGHQVARAYAADRLWRAETPQAARWPLLWSAYELAAQDGFSGTDTAAVLAHNGIAVHVTPSSAENPKVTVPADLAHAERLLASRA